MKKNDVLKEIVAKKKERLVATQQLLPLEALKEKISQCGTVRSFEKAIVQPRQISLIAEIKKASPSRGLIRADFSLADIARIYQESEVQAISVLTEEDYFQGNLAFLQEVRAVTSVPLLRKDFIVDEYQLYESRVAGADAMLLIADLLTQDQLSAFLEINSVLGLDSLIEVHDEKELKKVLKLKQAKIIGINNRDLRSLEVDLKTTEKLFPLVPREKTVVVESGLKSRQDVLFLKVMGVHACLIGEAFMETPNIRAKVDELMGW